MFFVRDPAKFPSLNRSHKRHPTTNASDADMFWDFHVNSPESIHALMFLFGDRGIPKSVRHTNAFSGNTYKLTKANGEYHYVRMHLLSDQGIECLADTDAARLAGTDPDNNVLDLQAAIEAGHPPSWTVYFQVIAPSDIAKAAVPIFDMTKVWPHKQYPLRRVGRLVLNRNPRNWFAEVEQAAFSPSNMVPGVEAAPDAMLQARMFAYPDAARYRLGANYQYLPTNAAKAPVYCPTERDGFMNFTDNYGSDPNYVGSQLKPVSFKASNVPQQVRANGAEIKQIVNTLPPPTLDMVSATTLYPVRSASELADLDYEQPRALWQNVMAKQEGAQARFVQTLAGHVAGVKNSQLRSDVYGK